MNNPDMTALFKCKPEELATLKTAFRRQMENNIVNNKPFLGQLASEADPTGQLREVMWNKVATENKTFKDMLTGRRWGSRKPDDFEARLSAAKKRICSDHNNERRKRKPGQAYAPGRDVGEDSDGMAESDDSSSEIPALNRQLRKRREVSYTYDDDAQWPVWDGESGQVRMARPRTEVPRMQQAPVRPAGSSWRTFVAPKRSTMVPVIPVSNNVQASSSRSQAPIEEADGENESFEESGYIRGLSQFPVGRAPTVPMMGRRTAHDNDQSQVMSGGEYTNEDDSAVYPSTEVKPEPSATPQPTPVERGTITNEDMRNEISTLPQSEISKPLEPAVLGPPLRANRTEVRNDDAGESSGSEAGQPARSTPSFFKKKGIIKTPKTPKTLSRRENEDSGSDYEQDRVRMR
jgi:hypothetical protein